jgi:hypothetical protein
MPNYGLGPAQQINRLTEQVRGLGLDKYRHQEAMQDYGLKGAQLGLQEKEMAGQQAFNIAKAQRDQFMNQKVTGRQAILTHPELSDDEKQFAIDTITKTVKDPESANYILDGAFFKRADFDEALRKTIDQVTQQAKESKYRQEKMGLEKQKLSILRQKEAKDTRTSAQKEFDRFKQANPEYKGSFLDFKQALKAKDPVETALTLSQNDPRWGYESPDVRRSIVQEYMRYFTPGKENAPQQAITLPDNITKTSEALDYLMKQGMGKEEAIQWIRDNAQ